MRYAVYLRFDEKAEKCLRDLRRAMMLEINGFPPHERKMPPHLTLLVVDAEDGASVKTRFEAFAPHVCPMMLNLAEINTFESERKVLFVEPHMTKALEETQQCCYGFFSDLCVIPIYRNPSLWRPHITLTKGLREEIFRQAQALAIEEWRAIEAQTTSLGLIDVNKPLEVLASREL